jgi:FPC/CPF motif-containing protein YcgG
MLGSDHQRNHSFIHEPESGTLYPQTDVYFSYDSLKLWQKAALDDFSARLGNELFPCLFGCRAWKSSSIFFLFCESRRSDDFSDFLSGLTEYTDYVLKTELRERLFSPLVAFFEMGFTSGSSQHSVGWSALNWAHQRDMAPWPDSIPMDPNDPDWCFCFNNVQLFINMSTNDHRILRNRNLGQFLTLVINPRENFDAVASVNTKSGRLVRDRIRSRVSDYNGGIVPAELGFYGEKNNREWIQYQLAEDSLERPATCPFQARKQT